MIILYMFLIKFCVFAFKNCSDQAARVFGLYIGLMLLLIIMGGALMFLCYKLCYKRYQCYDGEKELNEESYLLVKA